VFEGLGCESCGLGPLLGDMRSMAAVGPTRAWTTGSSSCRLGTSSRGVEPDCMCVCVCVSMRECEHVLDQRVIELQVGHELKGGGARLYVCVCVCVNV